MPDNSQREREIFGEAIELPSLEEQRAFVRGACGGDESLRQAVEGLLEAYSQAEGFIPIRQCDSVGRPDSAIPGEGVGSVVGRYKLLENIGEGGCGVVYVAEQQEPVRRRVALKVIKLGMDTRQVVARFEAERQALALMDHPNIARVLDAGATETGRPFFVMELVRGIKITDYCDQHQLSTTERLDLFLQVCRAVQHAHQKGIIHRDLKPSNILVTVNDGVAVPKVIDFGIAKATEGRLTDKTVYTELHQFIGTPAYMSPEQAEMTSVDIDTRSDIYSLGVLLYELLTGKTPFDHQELMRVGLDALRRTIRDKEPPRPSTRLSTLAAVDLSTVARARRSEPPKLIHSVRGDLDWIVMKCLEKDRARRYETANGLARDIDRHLHYEPVLARPPNAAYRIRKFIQRNKLSVTAASAVALALVLGILVSAWQALRATRLRRQAEVAQANETILRRQSQAQELAARQKAYASDLNLAQQALANNNLGLAQDLLLRQRPEPGQRDLRGWEWRYLWQQCRTEASYTLCQKSNEVRWLVTSPDGHWLALAQRDDPSLYVWDLRARREIARLPTGRDSVFDFAPNEPLIAYSETLQPDGTNSSFRVSLWNLATEQNAGEVPLDENCNNVVFAADGKTLGIVTGDDNNQAITLWRVADHTRLYRHSGLHVMTGVGKPSAFSPDLRIFAYGTSIENQHDIIFFDIATSKELHATDAPRKTIRALAFSPDGKTLASGEGFHSSPIQLWDVATARRLGVAEGHPGWVSSLVFSPDGKTLASAGSDQTIRLWDVSDSANPRWKRTMRGHRNEIWSMTGFADGATLFTGSKDGAVCCWNTSIQPKKYSHALIPQKVDYWTFDTEGDLVTVVREPSDFLVTEWKGRDFQTQGAQWRHTTNFLSAGIFPDGRMVGMLYTNGLIKLWDWRQGKELREFAVGSAHVVPLGFLAKSDRLVVLNTDDGWVSGWSIDTGQKSSLYEVNPREMEASDFGYRGFFSPDGQWAILPQGKTRFLIRNLTANQERLMPFDLREPDTQDHPYDSGFSPDSKLFALGSNLGYVKVWDVVSWRELATVKGFLQAPHCLTFSPDGQRIAVGSDGREAVKLFDVDRFAELLNLSADAGSFMGVAFSGDGNVLGACDDAGHCELWRAPSWEEITAADRSDPR